MVLEPVHEVRGQGPRIAEQAAHTPRSNGDATFIEVYARTLPELVKKALSARERAVR